MVQSGQKCFPEVDIYKCCCLIISTCHINKSEMHLPKLPHPSFSNMKWTRCVVQAYEKQILLTLNSAHSTLYCHRYQRRKKLFCLHTITHTALHISLWQTCRMHVLSQKTFAKAFLPLSCTDALLLVRVHYHQQHCLSICITALSSLQKYGRSCSWGACVSLCAFFFSSMCESSWQGERGYACWPTHWAVTSLMQYC